MPRDLVDKVVVGHALPIFHDSDDACLRTTCYILPNTGDVHSTSVWCLRSSSILSCVSFRSSVLSTFDEIVLILIFWRFDVNPSLNEKESSRFTSRPGGCFFKTLYFPQASDWRFRESSVSGALVAVLISFERTQNMSLLTRCRRVGTPHLIREKIVLLEILEEQKNDKCDGRHRQVMFPRLELDPDFPSAHGWLPSESSTGMLREIIHFERLGRPHEYLR